MYQFLFSYNYLSSSAYTNNNIIIEYNHIGLSKLFTTSAISYTNKKYMHSNTLDQIFQSVLSPPNLSEDIESLRYLISNLQQIHKIGLNLPSHWHVFLSGRIYSRAFLFHTVRKIISSQKWMKGKRSSRPISSHRSCAWRNLTSDINKITAIMMRLIATLLSILACLLLR